MHGEELGEQASPAGAELGELPCDAFGGMGLVQVEEQADHVCADGEAFRRVDLAGEDTLEACDRLGRFAPGSEDRARSSATGRLSGTTAASRSSCRSASSSAPVRTRMPAWRRIALVVASLPRVASTVCACARAVSPEASSSWAMKQVRGCQPGLVSQQSFKDLDRLPAVPRLGAAGVDGCSRQHVVGKIIGTRRRVDQGERLRPGGGICGVAGQRGGQLPRCPAELRVALQKIAQQFLGLGLTVRVRKELNRGDPYCQVVGPTQDRSLIALVGAAQCCR